MDDVFGAFLNGLFGTTSNVELEVMLPAGRSPLELYQILKNALDDGGCTLTNFDVKKDSA